MTISNFNKSNFNIFFLKMNSAFPTSSEKTIAYIYILSYIKRYSKQNKFYKYFTVKYRLEFIFNYILLERHLVT